MLPSKMLHLLLYQHLLMYGDKFYYFYSLDVTIIFRVQSHTSKSSLNLMAQNLDRRAHIKGPELVHNYSIDIEVKRVSDILRWILT